MSTKVIATQLMFEKTTRNNKETTTRTITTTTTTVIIIIIIMMMMMLMMMITLKHLNHVPMLMHCCIHVKVKITIIIMTLLQYLLKGGSSSVKFIITL